MAPSLSYIPEPHEQAYYLALFQAADVQKNGIISGAEAVQFFGRSKLPIEVLKNIWTVADQPSTSSLDHKKFAVAVRIIQLTQNGTKGSGPTLAAPPGVQLKPAFFEGLAPPQQQQQQPPPPTPQQPQRAMQPPPQPTNSPPRTMQQQVPPSPSRALVGMDPYSLSPQERSRYEGLFPQYAKTEADGAMFVYGSEAVPLFMKSGVDPNSLRDIWNMVDRNPVDNRLDKLEFALAMHLIVCVSKKNLPLPKGGTLPSSLQALKVAAGGNAAAAAAETEGTQKSYTLGAAAAVPPAAPAAIQPSQSFGMEGPPPLGSGAMGGVSISDAFEGLSTGPTTTTTLPSYVPQEPAAAPVVVEPPTPQPEPSYVVPPQPVTAETVEPPTPQPLPSYVQQPAPVAEPSMAASTTPPAPTPAATYEVSNSHQEELEKLKVVLQKLKAENISLKSQLGNMTEEEKNVQQELGQTVAEITALSSDLGAQRQQVLEAKNRLLEARAELKAQQGTKGVLTELISEAQQTKETIESATETLQSTAAAAPPTSQPFAGPEVDLFGTSAPATAGVQDSQEPEGFMNEHTIPNETKHLPAGVPSMPAPSSAEIAAPGTPTRPPQPMEQQQQIAQAPPPAMYSNYAAPAPPQAPQPAPPPMPSPMPERSHARQQQYLSPTNLNRPPVPGHFRQSSGFDSGFLMGGSPTVVYPDSGAPDADNVSQAAFSHASTGDYGYDDQAFEVVEGMKKRAKAADGVARDAEAASSKLAAEADELRADADRAEANYRSLMAAAEEKKKGRFGGGKKKKMMDGAEQAGKDAAEIKKHFMEIQGRALEAASVAAQTREEADKLLIEAEAAELKMAAIASAQQNQPASAPVPAPAPPQTNDYYGGNMAAPPKTGAMPMPQYGQAMPAPTPMVGYNGYNGYNANGGAVPGDGYGQQQHQNYGQASQPPGPMGANGGYDMPPPAAFQQMQPATAAPTAGGELYANPF